MKYMGSKARIAKYILPIILKDRKEGQWYVEPFVGGANMIDKVDGNRIGSDSNEYLIALLDALSKGWTPPEKFTMEDYILAKHNKNADKVITGYAGICCSYSGKWFGGYAGIVNTKTGSIRNYISEANKNLADQSKNILGVKFIHKSYDDIVFNKPCIIYCDPPYAGTTKYKSDFDHEKFWEWCREMSVKGHQVFVSEYNAPEDFECIWEMELKSSLSANGKSGGNKISTEKLFKYILP